MSCVTYVAMMTVSTTSLFASFHPERSRMMRVRFVEVRDLRPHFCNMCGSDSATSTERALSYAALVGNYDVICRQQRREECRQLAPCDTLTLLVGILLNTLPIRSRRPGLVAQLTPYCWSSPVRTHGSTITKWAKHDVLRKCCCHLA